MKEESTPMLRQEATQGKKGQSNKVEKAIDTLEARVIATHVLDLNDGVRLAAGALAIRAIATGLKLLKAKDLLEHGDFMAWRKKYISSLSHVTLQKYMNLALGVRAHNVTGYNLLDVEPKTLTEDYCRRVIPRLWKFIDGKSLHQICQDLQVSKPRQSCDHEAVERQERVDRLGPKDLRTEQRYLALDMFADIHQRLTRFEHFVEISKVEEDPELLVPVVEELKGVLERLTGHEVQLVERA